MSRRGWALFLALSVIWGIPYLLIRVAVRDLTPATLVFLRTSLGAALLLPLVIARGDLRAVLRRWRPVALFAVVEIAIPWVLLSDAERRVTSSLAGLLVASVPLVGALLARVSGRERIGGRRLAGLAAGFAGVAALVGLDVGGGGARVLAEMALVVLGYALGPVVVSRRLSDLRALDVVAVSLALCAALYAPVAVAQLPRAIPPMPVLGAIAGLAVFCTAVGFVLFFGLIAEIGPVRATVIAYVNPAVAVAAGVAVLGEPFTIGTAIGFVLILGGSWLATGAAGGPGRPVEAPGPRVGRPVRRPVRE